MTTLLLLPGLDGTGVLFEKFVEALPDEITAHVIAYPGDEPMSYPDLLAFIRERLPEGDGRFAVLGESFSGPLALELAVAEPRVSAVILCASFVTNPMRYIPRFAARGTFPFWFRAFPPFARAKTLLGGYSTRELRAWLARAHAMVTPRVLAARARSVLRLDARETLRRCPVPILYLAGGRDGVVRAHNPALIQRLRPDAELARVPAPHLVLQTTPREAAEVVAKFLRRVERR